VYLSAVINLPLVHRNNPSATLKRESPKASFYLGVETNEAIVYTATVSRMSVLSAELEVAKSTYFGKSKASWRMVT